MLGRHCEVVQYHTRHRQLSLRKGGLCATTFSHLIVTPTEVRLAKILCLKLEQTSGSCM